MSDTSPSGLELMHVAMVDAIAELDDYVDNGLAVHIIDPPRLCEATGAVSVTVSAHFLGAPVDVGDGTYQFVGMPLDLHGEALDSFKRELARIIKQQSGIDAG